MDSTFYHLNDVNDNIYLDPNLYESFLTRPNLNKFSTQILPKI